MPLSLQMQKIPDLEKLNIKDILSYGGAMERGEERAKKHDKAASLYNHVRALKINTCVAHASEGQRMRGCCMPAWAVLE